eukprot:GHVR01023329.1.p2 GENE.GHVR01023329.1~~GHVR01023329.1.p2  ORF type:complete len:108 (+),score=23.56 GHVR01023329.1:198-521(+)
MCSHSNILRVCLYCVCVYTACVFILRVCLYCVCVYTACVFILCVCVTGNSKHFGFVGEVVLSAQSEHAREQSAASQLKQLKEKNRLAAKKESRILGVVDLRHKLKFW